MRGSLPSLSSMSALEATPISVPSQLRNIHYMKSLRCNSHSCRKSGCNQGSNHTRHQSCIIHHSYTDYLQCKNSRSHRCSKQCRECCTPEYEDVCCGFIDDTIVKNYRKKMQCFRHCTAEAIAERKTYSEEQKNFLIDYGLTIVNAIYRLVK